MKVPLLLDCTFKIHNMKVRYTFYGCLSFTNMRLSMRHSVPNLTA